LNAANATNADITCFNCECKGHYKTDCWRPGGGKEGQGPNQKAKRGGARTQKQTANAAVETERQDQYAFVTLDLVSVAEQLTVPIERHGAIMDSGVTLHFCPDRAKFFNFVSIEPQKVHTADRSTLNTIRRGDVKLDLPLGDEWTTVMLKNALYAPTMAFTLISTPHITTAGLAVLFEGCMCKILSKGPNHTIIAEIPQVEGLYSVAARYKHRANLAKVKLTISELH
jgi:hypothetical protein